MNNTTRVRLANQIMARMLKQGSKPQTTDQMRTLANHALDAVDILLDEEAKRFEEEQRARSAAIAVAVDMLWQEHGNEPSTDAVEARLPVQLFRTVPFDMTWRAVERAILHRRQQQDVASFDDRDY